MRVFIDVNVFVDVLVLRENAQFTIDAARTLASLKQMDVLIMASAISVPVMAYVIKRLSPEDKKSKIKAVLQKVDILPSDKKHIESALNGKWRDIEDAMQYACALENACDIIITRDERDFKESAIPVMSPAAFLTEIN